MYKIPGQPEHYRLSATRLEGTKRQSPKTLVPVSNVNKHFWLRTRYVSAYAAGLFQLHPHVLELHICPSTVASLIGSCVVRLPAFAASWVQAVLPEWFLPSHVVLKKQKEDGEAMINEERFDTEVKAYGRLTPLQGVVIPTCYGRLR
ncbi:hypothetical protein B0T18DRAFT_385553 [Schizothecium vesticola]|uniref:Uncharacterized protein n=1 Tax=Schizothecium vesticola TaxID=314040 RepID=A0AA40FA44_9PEZI|nr:hypothetical protein B0T18DRAFT_385553 [Schizothecium vesticola]